MVYYRRIDVRRCRHNIAITPDVLVDLRVNWFVSLIDCLLKLCFDVADGDSEEIERYNSSNFAFPVARTPATSSVGGGEGETGHYDGTQRYYRGKCFPEILIVIENQHCDSCMFTFQTV